VAKKVTPTTSLSASERSEATSGHLPAEIQENLRLGCPEPGVIKQMDGNGHISPSKCTPYFIPLK
jgi:hypothetical protein